MLKLKLKNICKRLKGKEPKQNLRSVASKKWKALQQQCRRAREAASFFSSKCFKDEEKCRISSQDSIERQAAFLISNWKRQFLIDSQVSGQSNFRATEDAIEVLNNLAHGCVYRFESENGPPFAPIFTFSVDVNGKKYMGKGRNKAIARTEAAKLALSCISEWGDEGLVALLTSETGANVDSAAETFYMQNIVSILGELVPSFVFNYEGEEGPINAPVIWYSTEVNGRKYYGKGISKGEACNQAVQSAMLQNLNRNTLLRMPQRQADVIGRLVLRKFVEVTKGSKLYSQYKVLAGIVMTIGLNFSQATVICVSTGTKCVSGEHLSTNGAVINDSHAEILSRRCLMKFLYDQLYFHICSNSNQESSIFVRNLNNSKYPYRLRPDIHFHLYISTAPCGTARLFSPHERGLVNPQLRTKIESGAGTIPVQNFIQTWDGILGGERLRTMSCSDKIARWNVLGIQGCLLASIIEPIYLYSIVLGSLMKFNHMYSAVYDRLDKSIQRLPSCYILNNPQLAVISVPDCRNQSHTPDFGVNWTIGDNCPEIVQGFTGKTINNQISGIAKQSLFKKYVYLLQNLPEIQNYVVPGDYKDTKESIIDYQTAKKELFDSFCRENLGNWMKKPIDQDKFYLE